VIQLIQNADVDLGELARTIEYDPGLTSNILRLANSAYFGCPRSISTMREAVVRLGMNTMFQLVVTSAAGPLMRKPIKGYDLPSGKLWEHSVAVAIGVQQLAATLGIKPPDYTFTAALLHDVGKVVLGTFLEVDAGPIMDLAFEEQISFEVAEQQVLGIDHAEIGAILLEDWNLPKYIVDVVRWHHQPEHFSGNTLVVDLVHVADNLSMLGGIGTGSDGLNYCPSEEVTEKLNITTHIAESVICKILIGLDQLSDLLTSMD
jgi:putative nucleotidyltransferase with HDIG domain